MSLAQAMADIALSISSALGGPFHDARVITPVSPTFDDGGSIVPGGAPTLRTCSAQVDAATETMRSSADFTEKDKRILVLAGTLDGDVTTDHRIEMLAGPDIGIWSVQSVDRDSCAVYWECRARPA